MPPRLLFHLYFSGRGCSMYSFNLFHLSLRFGFEFNETDDVLATGSGQWVL